MMNPAHIEEKYKEFLTHLGDLAHDGIVDIDLKFLHETALLQSLNNEEEDLDDLTQYFHVLESAEKVTLFNDQFLVWILPKLEEEQPITYVMIALNYPEHAHLEVVFTTRGIYNTPRYVLKVLQNYLLEMLETEATISAIENNQ